jgi:hypothetical protein
MKVSYTLPLRFILHMVLFNDSCLLFSGMLLEGCPLSQARQDWRMPPPHQMPPHRGRELHDGVRTPFSTGQNSPRDTSHLFKVHINV